MTGDPAVPGQYIPMVRTGRLASQSDLIVMTYKVVHIEGMDVDMLT